MALIDTAGGRKVVLDNTCNIVTHGNSITFGTGSSDAATKVWSAVMLTLPGFAGKGVGLNKNGVHGQGWDTMLGTTGTPTGIDNLYNASKAANVLIAQEGTNAMREIGQYTARQAADRCWQYFRNRLLLNPGWLAVTWTVLPTWTSDGIVGAAAINARITEYNDIMRAEWRQEGLSACIDMRAPGSIWSGAHTTEAEFLNRQFVWAESSFQTHPGDQGYRKMADIMATGVFNLRHKTP